MKKINATKETQKKKLFKDLQIISGKYKRKLFFRADAEITRPLLIRSRQAIFNILYSWYPEKFNKLLDCFAGSGTFAIEALSRQAVKSVVMVDLSSSATEALKENAKMLDEEDFKNTKIINADITQIFLNHTDADLVFIDPPYAITEEITENLFQQIQSGNFKKDTVFIIGYDGNNPQKFKIPDNTEKWDERNYGRNTFLFLKIK